MGTQHRCYGYTPDGEIVDHEATVIRGVAMSVLSGQMSLRAVVEELNASGMTTTTGGRWQLTPLVRLLTNPRLAGLAPKHRRTTEPAPAILTPDQHHQLTAAAQARRDARPAHRIQTRHVRLLSGLVVCAKDGAHMTGHVNAHGASYRCPSGHAQVQGELLEHHVAAQAIRLLRDGHPPVAPASVGDYQAQLAKLSEMRTQITQARNAGILSEHEAESAWRRIKKRRTVLRERIEQVSEREPLVLPAPGQDPEQWWAQASAEQRRAVIAGYFEEIVVSEPTRRGSPGLDQDRVHLKARRDLAPLAKAS